MTTAADAMTVFARRIDHLKPIYEPMKNFKVQLSDIFITAFPTCGTVWMQNIIHQLRGGDEFDEIGNVVPYVSTNNVLGEWERVSAGFRRRAFKTHMIAEKALGFGGCQ